MDINKISGLTFIKCRNPTYVLHNGYKQYVSCGSCDLCLAAKSQKHTLSLSLEERHHIFSYFITLTYNEEFVPRYRIVDDNETKSFYTHSVVNHRYLDTEEYLRNDLPLESCHLEPCFFRYYPVGKRGLQYELRDADSQYYPNIDLNGISYADINNYYNHRCLYVSRYSKTSFQVPERGYVDLCPIRDLQLFIQGLKNYAWRKHKAKFKYFAVPDYGTNGLRPHWHIEIFFDSYELFRDFEHQRNYGTAQKPSYGAVFLSNIWRYGIFNSSRVKKSTSSYVAGYLNSVSQFPRLLRYAQRLRCYHSPLLGQVLPSEIVYTQIRKRNFQFFEHIKDYSYDGTEYEYRWRSALYNHLLPRLPYLDAKNAKCCSVVARKIIKFIDSCKSLSPGFSYVTIASALYDYASSSSDITLRDYLRIQNYNRSHYHNDLNLFYRLVLVCSTIRKRCFYMDVSLDEYFDIVASYINYRERQPLLTLYQALEIYPSLSVPYYDALASDYSMQSNNAFYNVWLSKQTSRLLDNVKHRDIAERYKFN